MLEPWDFSRDFRPQLVASGLTRLWTVDGHSLAPALDVTGEVPQCPLSLETFHDPVLLADGFVYECAHIARWLRKHGTSPCINTTLPHKAVLKLRPWHAAISSFLLEDSRRRVTKDSLENASHEAERALLSSDPEEIRSALLALRVRLEMGSAELQSWQDAVSRATDSLDRIQQKASTMLATHVQTLVKVRSSRSHLCFERQRAEHELSTETRKLYHAFHSRRLLVNLSDEADHQAQQAEKLTNHFLKAVQSGTANLVSLFLAKRADVDKAG